MADQSYNESECVFCHYRPGVTGHLNLLIINGDFAFVCAACESQTIPQERHP